VISLYVGVCVGVLDVKLVVGVVRGQNCCICIISILLRIAALIQFHNRPNKLMLHYCLSVCRSWGSAAG
jgi:hypothetical protein